MSLDPLGFDRSEVTLTEELQSHHIRGLLIHLQYLWNVCFYMLQSQLEKAIHGSLGQLP